MTVVVNRNIVINRYLRTNGIPLFVYGHSIIRVKSEVIAAGNSFPFIYNS